MKFTLGKIVTLAGLLVLLIGFFCPFALKKVKDGYGDKAEWKTNSAVYLALGAQIDNGSQDEAKQKYNSVAYAMVKGELKDNKKAGPVGPIDIVMGIVFMVAVIGAIALEVVPGIKEKAKCLDLVSKLCFWVSICLGIAIASLAFQTTLLNYDNMNSYTVAGWIMLVGVVAALVGDNFDGAMAIVNDVKAKKVPTVAVLAKPAAFIFALTGAGFVAANMAVIRFAVLPAALAVAAFGAVALAVLKKN